MDIVTKLEIKIDPFSSFFNFHLYTNQETQIKIFNKVYLENWITESNVWKSVELWNE